MVFLNVYKICATTNWRINKNKHKSRMIHAVVLNVINCRGNFFLITPRYQRAKYLIAIWRTSKYSFFSRKMHRIACIQLLALYCLHCIACIELFALNCLHWIACIVLLALNCLHRTACIVFFEKIALNIYSVCNEKWYPVKWLMLAWWHCLHHCLHFQRRFERNLQRIEKFRIPV